MGNGRFGVLLCAEDSDYLRKRYGGFFAVFVGMLAEEGETWDVFRASAGELPEDSDLADYDGFVITGSCRDAHGDDPWISDLCALLKRLQALRKRVLGICFGHQILELPPSAEVLAWSDKTKVEMFKCGDHILGIQGHPEYNKDILLHLIDRLIHRNLIQESFADKARAKLEKSDPNREAWKRLCRSFLKGGL